MQDTLAEFLSFQKFSLTAQRPKLQNSCSQMWLIEQLFIELGRRLLHIAGFSRVFLRLSCLILSCLIGPKACLVLHAQLPSRILTLFFETLYAQLDTKSSYISRAGRCLQQSNTQLVVNIQPIFSQKKFKKKVLIKQILSNLLVRTLQCFQKKLKKFCP